MTEAPLTVLTNHVAISERLMVLLIVGSGADDNYVTVPKLGLKPLWGVPVNVHRPYLSV